MGGWMGVGERVPHASHNLCRVGIDIPVELDEEFKLEPTKTDYTIPELFKGDLNLLFNTTSRAFSDGPNQYTFLTRGKHRARYESTTRVHKDQPKKSNTKKTETKTKETEETLMVSKTVKKNTKKPKVTAKGDVKIEIVDSPFMTELMWVETKVTGTKIYLNKGHSLYDKTLKSLKSFIGLF